MEVLALACKQISGTFSFPGSGAVKRFVITTSVNQVSTANVKFEAAKRLDNPNIYHSGKQICFKGDPELSMTRNCRVYFTTY